MAKLTQYLDVPTLQELQDCFVAVAQVPVAVFGDGRRLTKDSFARLKLPREHSVVAAEEFEDGHEAPIVVDGQALGRVVTPRAGGRAGEVPLKPWQKGMIELLAAVLGRLYGGQRQLRTRVSQLATLYKLTAEFSGQRDLQSLLDLIARTVVEVTKAKACSIRLLNEDRTELVIKAVANLSPEYLNKGRILLKESLIDQEVLQTNGPVYIADERTDPRVLYPSQAKREGIVSALCAPMSYKGRPEGVIRVYMSRRHKFDWFEASLLSAVAAEAGAAVVNARLTEEAVRAATLERQLAMAGEVQRQMIPARPPSYPGIEIGTVYVPCFELGGDFFDFIDLPPDNFGLAICDVVGKGVRASLLMASIRASLRAHAANIYDMSHVLGRVNRDLCSDTLISDFATLFYGVIDFRSRRLTYANAGHMPPLLIRDGQLCHLAAGGGLLGIDSAAQWRHEAVSYRSGDVILAYTDGLSEAMNFNDEPFGRLRVQNAALAAISRGEAAEGIAKHVLWEMRRFAGLQTRCDDLTIVVVKAL